jgi:GNAT superfamily N-acetyltransferase
MGNTGRRAGLPIGRSGADTRDMSPDHIGTLRVAAVAEAGVVAEMLDAFNREYHTPTPGPAVLTGRLSRLLADGTVIAVLAGQPAVAVALLTLRPNVWYEGPVALLDELYVVPALRRQGIGSALLDRAEAVARQTRSRDVGDQRRWPGRRRSPLLRAPWLHEYRARPGRAHALLLLAARAVTSLHAPDPTLPRCASRIPVLARSDRPNRT